MIAAGEKGKSTPLSLDAAAYRQSDRGAPPARRLRIVPFRRGGSRTAPTSNFSMLQSGFVASESGTGIRPEKREAQEAPHKINRPPSGGRLRFRRRLPLLEAPARHAGVEHGHGAVDDVGQLGVRSREEREEIKDKAHTKFTLALLKLSKNQRDSLQQFPGGS